MIRLKNADTQVLNTLQKRMLPALTLPLSEDCPTSLRYALAKYDAEAVAEAYEGLYELSLAGELENAE